MPSEFELIERFFVRAIRRDDVVKGIGDDAAVLRLPPNQDVIATVDTLIEGVHFPRGAEPDPIGHKSLAVNLSDLAAMGAEPAWTTLSLTLPEADESWLREFSAGFLGLAERFEVQLVGGDLTRGPLSIAVQALGLTPCGTAIGRDGACPGDLIVVTGSVGDAGLALEHVQAGRHLGKPHRAYLLARLHRPEPRVAAGLRLRGLASAAIDISDGLIADLGHILKASGVGARIELESLPLSEALRAHFNAPADWRLPLAAGDDYELMFTAAEVRHAALERHFRALAQDMTVIGRIEAEPGLRMLLHGKPFAAALSGYDHFIDDKPPA